MSKLLGVPVLPEQVLLSHTPYRSLAKEIGDSRVLVIGSAGAAKVARSYGFRKVSTVRQLLSERPALSPHRRAACAPCPFAHEPIAAALIIHDPDDWAVEMQVLVDVLTCPELFGTPLGSPLDTPQLSLRQHIPLYACNADLVYTSEHPHVCVFIYILYLYKSHNSPKYDFYL